MRITCGPHSTTWPMLWSPSVAEGGAYCRRAGRGTPLVIERPVRCDERAGTELEAAATGAEHTGVDGVVPDRVEEPGHRGLRGRVVPGDRQSATVGRADRASQRGEVPEGDVVEHLHHVRGTQVPLEHLASGQRAVVQPRYRPVALRDVVDRVEDRLPVQRLHGH